MTLSAKLISTFTTLGSVCVDTAVILRRLVLVSRKSEYKEAVEGGETVNERQKTRVRFVGGWGISLPTAQLHPHKGGIDIPTKPRKSIFPPLRQENAFTVSMSPSLLQPPGRKSHPTEDF